MKIAITYEKADILRLVGQDIKAQGVRVKAGTSLEYKGPLQVKFSVETDDEAPPVSEMKPPSETPVPKPVVTEESTDMSSVLAASRDLSKTTKGIYDTKPGVQRQLAPNESYEYPKE